MLADPTRTDQTPPDELARRFEWFADHVFSGTSPIYEQFARRVAGDPDLLQIAAAADPNQPVPVLFLAAVQHLLLEPGRDPGPLVDYYPSLSGDVARPDDDPYPHFREFCLGHRSQIELIVQTRRTQTNEVRRCTGLMPVFAQVAQTTACPLNLIELGPSAGLNLLWDQYAYDYGDGTRIGSPHAHLVLSCDVRGERRPPLPASLPEVASRIGIDLNPVDLTDPAEARWLRALIWPEHTLRAQMLTKAIEVARREPPPLVQGNVLDVLPESLRSAPADAALCVFHSYMLNQFPAQARDALREILMAYSHERTVHRVSIEWLDGGPFPLLRLARYERGEELDMLLARCDQHGAWIEWLAE